MKIRTLLLILAVLIPVNVWATDTKISAMTAKTAPVAADTMVIVDSADGSNKKVTIGTQPIPTTQTSTAALESATLGTEETDANTWTSAGWTGSYAAGFTHTAGNTSALSRPMTNAYPDYYQVSFTVTGNSAGSFNVTLGGTSSLSFVGTQIIFGGVGTFGPQIVAGNGPLIFTPTSDFNGTISNISVKKITAAYNPINVLKDSGGNVVSEMRSSPLRADNQLNTFQGVNSGSYNTTGYNNLSYGQYSLTRNTTGFSNVALGNNVLQVNSVGYENVGVGAWPLVTNTTGYNNTGVGYVPLYNNTTGYYNTGIGSFSLTHNTTGYQNSAVGVQSLYTNTTGIYNSAFGNYALNFNLDGHDNTAAGYQSLYTNTSGINNTAVGSQALYSNDTGNQSVAVGTLALYTSTGSYNTGVGYEALWKNTTGTYNTAIGNGALKANNGAGASNVACGASALTANTTAINNTATGTSSLFTNTTGHDNTAMGFQSMFYMGTSSFSTGIGSQALYNATGTNNVGVGYNAMYGLTTGANNTAVGTAAGRYITGGSVANTAGSSSVYIGYACQAHADTEANQIVIGASAIGNGDNTTTIGTTATTKATIYGLTPVTGTITSSATPYPSTDGTNTGTKVHYFTITALAADAQLKNPIGTWNVGEELVVAITGDATLRNLTYDTAYVAGDTTPGALPSVAIQSKTIILKFICSDGTHMRYVGYAGAF